MTAPLDLDALERLLAEATPGPWEWWTSNSYRRITARDKQDGGVMSGQTQNDGHNDLRCRDEDAALIVAAVNALPALIAELRAARQDAATARHTANELMLVVEDFLPNVGRCALQNYARLNTAMIAGEANRAAIAKGGPTCYAKGRRKTVEEQTRVTLNVAVRSGAVVKPKFCTGCGITGRLHGHHHDYAQPLNVTWLCAACHGKAHRMIDAAQGGKPE